MSGVRKQASEWEDLARRVLGAAGAVDAVARSVARALVAAEEDGLPSHGLARLRPYCAQLRSGKVRGDAAPVLTSLGPSAGRIDAADGFAFPAMDLAVETAVEMAAASAVAALAVTNSHHFGVAGYHVERLARRGMVGLVFGNSPAAIAPWGGSRKVFGTNPIAFAAPRPDDPPLVIDLSLSKQARGKIMLAASRGEAIPEGWALDADGNPTTDAEAALAGSMVPMGEAKGSALVLAVEILAAALTGAHFGFEASSFFTAEGDPPRVGQFLLAFDPAPFSGGGFDERIEALVAAIESQPGARLPGARRLRSREQAHADGIETTDELHRWMRQEAGLDPGG
jgi:(2R)-3-sulfolactate dehydrogenase (NADP+)